MVTARVTTRGYSSPARREKRNQTQLAILKAAEAMFKARGYSAATMQGVADSAGVSLPTVYLYFRSKPDLVRSLADLVTSSADLSVEHVLAETDPKRQLEIGAGILRALHERSEVVATSCGLRRVLIPRCRASGSAGRSATSPRWARSLDRSPREGRCAATWTLRARRTSCTRSEARRHSANWCAKGVGHRTDMSVGSGRRGSACSYQKIHRVLVATAVSGLGLWAHEHRVPGSD